MRDVFEGSPTINKVKILIHKKEKENVENKIQTDPSNKDLQSEVNFRKEKKEGNEKVKMKIPALALQRTTAVLDN